MFSRKENILVSWFSWHFFEMPVFLFEVWKNYLSFLAYYFSIPLLAGTLLSPWRQYRWRYPRGFDIGGYLSVFVSNLFSRLMGLVARLVLILAGLAVQLIVAILGMLGIMAWTAMPVAFGLLAWLLA